ncbi:hypothetical protein QBC35DRAFT_505780 [Podospora australis]|uniref:Galactose oxidase n=1 Tax=Podospora australis TaxID=1536484 RepID=A0AAN6WM09_9PEZI|nr:hypothetical protein QBC35DRAFT_505780 [Podospora australis]
MKYHLIVQALSLSLTIFDALASPTTSPQVSRQISSWKTLAPIPTGPIHEHSTVLLSPTQLVTVGGVLQSGGVINSVYLYDIPSDSWKKLAPLPVAINHANAAAVDGKLYVLGGMIVSGGNWVGTPRSWIYDPNVGDKWTPLDPMPASETARGSAVVGVHNGTIWLVSGKTGSGTNGKSVPAVSAFDTKTKTWVVVPEKAREIPEGRDHGGGGVVGDKFYQIGGSLGPIENRKDTVFVLDLKDGGTKGWVTAAGKMPTPRRGFATGQVGSVFYTFGGEGNPDLKYNGVFEEVEAYDTAADTWRRLSPMGIPRHGSSAVSVGGKVYIPGGGTASGMPCTDKFDVFTP